ncbi:hypothetical protein HBI80_100580 [Parastagonospora nodorum]|nr:hypothetical protein HBH52_040110 [Parastagonospora nodorum]KAH4904889.1 hypothetical protein HBI80_100580 [Parastagonospora nodorum]KAH6470448.1 hypothetical protein HBI59_039420 [Parastagonospora nodorum]
MAVSLTAWLEEELATQLLLGNHWLQEKNKQKQSGVKADPERVWRGLYHDNGSCLEITNDIHPDRNSFLKIIQFSPYLFTDGNTQTGAVLSPACFRYLHPRAQIHDVVRIRKYTIRFTSYGPPDEHLQFILDSVDWLGYHSAGNQQQNVDELKPLWSAELRNITRQLHETRAREDRRCLDPDNSPEQGADDTSVAMAGSDEAGSQSHTQVEFGTQLPQDDGPRFLGVNRREPVLAGNTQREEIRPVPPKPAKPVFNDRKKLLGLLHKPCGLDASETTKPPPNRSPRAIVDRPPKPTHASGSQLTTQLPVNINRQPTQMQSASTTTKTDFPEQVRSTSWAGETEASASHVAKHTHHRSSRDATAPKSEVNQLQKLASECSWMQDLEFTRETFRVPSEQLNILRKDDSWHKPRPGCKFPDGNIPIHILTMLYRQADENADLDAGPDSDDEMDEDPSPEFPVESTNASAESAPQTTPDDQLPTSQVSWSASPTPEPPRLPTRSNQQLPPDSSFEPVDHMGPAEDDDAGKSVVSSQIPDPILIDSSNEDEQNDPPSSPPVAEDAADTDEDIEMEEHVPQALGEDSVERVDDLPQRPVPAASPPPRSVVQVKETPYVRSKNGQLRTQADPAPSRKLSSSGTSKHTSSTSIVHGTYNDKPSSDLQVNAAQTDINVTDLEQGLQKDGLQLKQWEREVAHEISSPVLDNAPLEMIGNHSAMPEAIGASRDLQPAIGNDSPRKSMVQDATIIEVPEPNLVSAHMPPSNSGPIAEPSPPHPIEGRPAGEDGKRAMLSKSPSRTPGALKRKHDNSLSRRNSRQSKRREIKIVGFGDDPPDLTDPALTIRHYREESLRQYREARKSSSSVENGPQSAAKAEAPHGGDAMQIDTSAISPMATPVPLSPLHDSLHKEPSPAFPVVEDATAAAMRSASVTVPTERVQRVSTPEVSRPQASHVATSTRKAASSVFERFKAAYPEYTGDTKHFQGQCTQIIQLDREDKMVPKWQWDDYIIRNRTDYKDYAVERMDQGENPEPYHRFYKDMIRDTIYRKGIIDGRNTLIRALQQLNAPLPERESRDSPKNPSRKEKRARASLPSAFHQAKPISKNHQAISAPERPRNSLPPRPQHNPHTPARDPHIRNAQPLPPAVSREFTSNERSSPRPHSLSRLSLDGAASPCTTPGADTTAGASDPFRDFVFAYQRTTSFTGSTKVDPRLPWPKNLCVRPSMADALKSKVDVMKWKDVL